MNGFKMNQPPLSQGQSPTVHRRSPIKMNGRACRIRLFHERRRTSFSGALVKVFARTVSREQVGHLRSCGGVGVVGRGRGRVYSNCSGERHRWQNPSAITAPANNPPTFWALLTRADVSHPPVLHRRRASAISLRRVTPVNGNEERDLLAAEGLVGQSPSTLYRRDGDATLSAVDSTALILATDHKGEQIAASTSASADASVPSTI